MVKSKSMIIYFNVLMLMTMLVSLHPMISSTYVYANKNSILYFLCTVLPMFVLFILTTRYCSSTKAPAFCAFGTILTAGNASAMPLLKYTSAYDIDNVMDYARSICVNSVIVVSFTIATWICMWMVSSINEESKTFRWVNRGLIGLCVIFSALILLFTDKESGTTIIQLSGMSLQAAIPVMIVSILSICFAWHSGNKMLRFATLGCVALVNVSLFLCGETGIPLITLLAFSIWYFMFQPYKYRILSVAIPCTLGLGLVSVFVLHILTPFLPNSGFLGSLTEKIERRIFSSSVDQVERVLLNVRTGGLWGSNAYNVNVPEASSDFALTTIIHYTGFVFLILVLLVAMPAFYLGAKQYAEEKHTLSSDIGGVSLSTFFVMFFYNMLMCSGHLPVLGSQIPFTGVSITYGILTGFLHGAITYPEKTISALVTAIKGGTFYEKS